MEWCEGSSGSVFVSQADGDKEPPVVRGNSTRDIFMLAIPTFFDLIATVLMNIGLLSVTASVYQMMRGAEMLFAALFAVTFLNRNLNRMHFLGIMFCVDSPQLVKCLLLPS